MSPSLALAELRAAELVREHGAISHTIEPDESRGGWVLVATTPIARIEMFFPWGIEEN